MQFRTTYEQQMSAIVEIDDTMQKLYGERATYRAKVF